MQELVSAIAVFSILFIALTATSIYILYNFSKGQKHKTMFKGEYDIATLFIPYKKGMNLKDTIMMIFISPYFWLFEFTSVFLFGLLMLISSLSITDDLTYGLLLFISSGLISFTFTFFYAVLLWWSDYKEREPLRFIPTLFLWGCMAALIAIIFEEILEVVLGIALPNEFAPILAIITTILTAPIIEELIKGLGVLVISYHHEFDGITDGLVYGFIIGAGFAFLEDWGYYLNYPPSEIGFSAWLMVIGFRTVLTSVVHGIFTGFSGAVLGYFKQNNIPKRWLVFPLVALVGGFVHMVFNGLSIIDGLLSMVIKTEIPLCVLGFTILLVIFFALLIKNSLKGNE